MSFTSLCERCSVLQATKFCRRGTVRWFCSKTGPPWRVLVFGSSRFGVNTLDALCRNRTSEDKVVAAVELIAVDKTPMRSYAEENGVKIRNWPPILTDGEYDVGVVVSFGHLIPRRIIEKFPHGILNVHPSLLPRWRGAAPVQHSILAGDHVTGVSIMEIRPKRFDVGPILLQEKIQLPSNVTADRLSDQLSQMGAQMLLQALRDLPQLRQSPLVQIDEEATYAHKLTLDMAFVNWAQDSCEAIDRQSRALADQIALRSIFLDKPIQLLDIVAMEAMCTLADQLPQSTPSGSVRYSKASQILAVRCKDGWVGFRQVVFKKTMTAKSFQNGYLSKVEQRNQTFRSVENTALKYMHKPRRPL